MTILLNPLLLLPICSLLFVWWAGRDVLRSRRALVEEKSVYAKELGEHESHMKSLRCKVRFDVRPVP